MLAYASSRAIRDECRATPNTMAVAYSDKPITRSAITGVTAAGMISDLHGILIGVDWSVSSTVTGGYIFEMTSPQTVDYKAHVLIQDDLSYKIDNPTVSLYNFRSMVVVVMNVIETAKSFPYQVRADSFYASFQVIAGRSQLFISVPGITDGHHSSFACGIPWLPPPGGACQLGTPVITDDIWWANGGSQYAFDWRSQANAYACMTYYRNGAIVIAADNNNERPLDGLLCLFPLTAVNTYAVDQIPWPTITYQTHRPLAIDAFVGWNWAIQGQLWDAYLQTAAGTIDSEVSAIDRSSSGLPINVRSLTWHSQFYSSLQLIFAITGGGFGNVAY